MIIKTKKGIPASEITSPELFKNRRKIIRSLLALPLLGAGVDRSLAGEGELGRPGPSNAVGTEELSPTPYGLMQNYTNYYEYSFNKEDSTELAQKMVIDPWSVEITGEVENGGIFNLEHILAKQTLKEYVCRFRCVEAWSMVVPWMGFPLANLLKWTRPLSSARFVKFTSAQSPEAMPNLKVTGMLDWPYVEGLRLDEAMHPLALLAVGAYGERLPKQNGAPLRLVVPWKYGFKSIKAVVKIELLKRAPGTSWSGFAPKEYGFYANVNPFVPHPRWSQYSERVLGSAYFTPRRKTEIFNGYGAEVAGLYKDMDLSHHI